MENKKFELFDTNWSIEFVDNIETSDEEGYFWFGDTNGIDKRIRVATKGLNNKNLSKKEINLTLLHELVHAILITGNYHDINRDEPLIEWIAKCINSLLKQKILKT